MCSPYSAIIICHEYHEPHVTSSKPEQTLSNISITILHYHVAPHTTAPIDLLNCMTIICHYACNIPLLVLGAPIQHTDHEPWSLKGSMPCCANGAWCGFISIRCPPRFSWGIEWPYPHRVRAEPLHMHVTMIGCWIAGDKQSDWPIIFLYTAL